MCEVFVETSNDQDHDEDDNGGYVEDEKVPDILVVKYLWKPAVGRGAEWRQRWVEQPGRCKRKRLENVYFFLAKRNMYKNGPKIEFLLIKHIFGKKRFA